MNHPWINFSGPALALITAACSAPPRTPPATNGNSQVTIPTTQPKSRQAVPSNQRGTVSAISFGDFFALQQSGKTLVYDARQAFFYHLGHIPGAINLPPKHCAPAITTRQSEIKAALAAGKTIIVYCSSSTCPDARSVATQLSACGYPARIFPGGWEEWRTADPTN